MNSFGEPGLFDPRSLKFDLSLRALLGTLLCIALASLAAFLAKPDLGEAASALIFVLGILLTGALFGLVSALIAAIAISLLYNFYLTEPVLTFSLATASDIAPFVVFNLSALVAGILAGRLKDRAQAASRSNLLLSHLLTASEALQSAVRLQDIGAVLAAAPPGRLGSQVRLFGARNADLVPLHSDGAPADFEAAARTAFRGEVNRIAPSGLLAYPLEGSRGTVGVIVMRDPDPDTLDPHFLAALGNLVMIAIERATLSEAISESRATARTEELKTALLSSVSHDFRTPLTAISASASSLIDYRTQLDQHTSERLLRSIVDECERLNRYTANLLEMSRLEAGQSAVRRQPLDVFDILRAVLKRVRARAGLRVFEQIRDDVELTVLADAALFELALVNLLDNAILYSPDGSTIRIEARCEGMNCRIAISDEGSGIPPDDLERVFERFYRVPRSGTLPRGSGLGLAIARGFVEAFDGSIEACVPGVLGRGTSIVINLPLIEPSP